MYTNIHQDTLKNSDRTALITGAGQGIGAEIARCFAAKGYFVALVDYNEELGVALEKKMAGKAKFYHCDLSKQAEVDALACSLQKDLHFLDTIVHSAKAPAREKDLFVNLNCEWDNSFNVMLKHPVFLNHRLLDQLKRSQNPSIIFIGSTNAHFISQQPLSYHVVKGALSQTVRYLACEYSSFNIRVNLLNPGIVDVSDRQRRNPELFNKVLESVIPLKRAASASEVAEFCYFIASKEAKYMTGASIDLDGGEHLKDHFHLLMTHFSNQNVLSGV